MGVNVWPTHVVTPMKSAEKYEGGVLDTPVIGESEMQRHANAVPVHYLI